MIMDDHYEENAEMADEYVTLSGINTTQQSTPSKSVAYL